MTDDQLKTDYRRVQAAIEALCGEAAVHGSRFHWYVLGPPLNNLDLIMAINRLTGWLNCNFPDGEP